MTTEKILNENEKILKFIKNYQEKNSYDLKFMDEYNKKFNAEFNHFLKNGKFSKETVNLFES